MPRGLGDSPLSRAKKGRKGSASSPPTTNESAGGQSVVESAVTLGASHNDVFFQRRVDETTPVFENNSGPHEVIHYGEVATATDIPEIAEVTDIVRIAEVTQSVKSAPLLPEVAQLPQPETVVESAHPPLEEPAVVVEAAPLMTEEEEPPVVVVEPAQPAREEEKEPVPVISAAQEPETKSESQTPTETRKNSGFLKRLFGRFGK